MSDFFKNYIFRALRVFLYYDFKFFISNPFLLFSIVILYYYNFYL